MKKRSLFSQIFGNKKNSSNDKVGYSSFELLNSNNTSFTPWNGRIFDNDIVRSCIRPTATFLGKLKFKHVRDTNSGLKIYSSGNTSFLLRYPNRYMTMKKLLEKMAFQLEIEGNAYAFVRRENNVPVEIFPIPYNRTELVEYKNELYMKFTFSTGQHITVAYEDVIHLKKDFFDNDFYGTDSREPLKNIMNVIDTTDKGVVQAIKTSAVIKWLLKFKTVLSDKDREKAINKFADNYLDIENETNKNVAAIDPRYDVEQVKDNNYVPNDKQMGGYTERLYNFFSTNEKIVNNSFSENEWTAFYEGKIEPIAEEFTNLLTKILFSKHEIECGNRIAFEPASLQFASMTTKLSLVQMVDRGAMTPNEWREVMNLSPIENGDKPIRRLDTAVVENEEEQDIKLEGAENNER